MTRQNNEKMKKINLTLIFFILIGNSLLSQESDYYKILDELLPKIESKLIKKSNDSFFKSTDDVLTRLEFNRYMHVDTAIKQSDWNQIIVPDEQYITEQLKNPNYKWRRRLNANKNIQINRFKGFLLPVRQLIFHNVSVKKTIYTVSKPIFINKNNEIALVYYSCYSGSLSGSGNVVLLMKIDDDWKQICFDMIWIS